MPGYIKQPSFSNLNGSANITSNSASVVPLTTRGAASQSANLQEWKNSVGTTVASVASDGNIVGGGLVFLNKTDFTTAANVTIDNIFSSTYDNYKIIVQFTAMSANDIDIFWYGRSGNPATDTTTNYNTQSLRQSLTTVAGSNLSNSRIGNGSSAYATYPRIICDLFTPNLATRTSVYSECLWIDSLGTQQAQRFMSYQDSTTQFTGIKLLPNNGTFSGTIRIYGYKN